MAGIPSKGSVAHLFSYFETYGPIRGIELYPGKGMYFLSPGERWLPRYPLKGYCILHMENPEDARLIIRDTPHQLGERVLSCKAYLRGEELRNLNLTLCNKRLILKQVPKDVDMAKLKEQLEALAGPIESFYVLVTDRETSLQRRHSTCSVLFQSEIGREMLLRLGSMPGPDGKPIYFRAYEQKNKNVSGPFNKRQILSKQSNGSVLTTPTSHAASQASGSQSFAETQKQRNTTNQRHLSKSGTENSPIMEPREAEESLESNFHSLKPNRSKYFALRGLVEGFPAGNLQPIDQVCFNLSKSRVF